MFTNAASFRQRLCGRAWVHSKASKIRMFEGVGQSSSSRGKIGSRSGRRGKTDSRFGLALADCTEDSGRQTACTSIHE